jgi:hypothetical protein
MSYAVDLWGMGITLFLLVFGDMTQFVFSPPTLQSMGVYAGLSAAQRGSHRAELRSMMKTDHEQSMTRLLHAAADGRLDSTTFVWLRHLLAWEPAQRMELFSTSKANMAKAIKSAERLIDSVRKDRQTGQGGQSVGGGGRAQPALQRTPARAPVVNAPRVQAAMQAPVEVPHVEAPEAPAQGPVNEPQVEAPVQATVPVQEAPMIVEAPVQAPAQAPMNEPHVEAAVVALVEAPVEGPRVEVAVSRRGVDERKTAALLGLLSMGRAAGTTAGGGDRAVEAVAPSPPQQGVRQGSVGVDVEGTAVLKAFLGMGQPQTSRGAQRAEGSGNMMNNNGRLTAGGMSGRRGEMDNNEGRRINGQGGGDRAPVQDVRVQGGNLQGRQNECHVRVVGTRGAPQAGVQSTRGPQPRRRESAGRVEVVAREDILLMNNQVNNGHRGVREAANNAGGTACEHDRSGGRRRRPHQRRRSRNRNHHRRGTAERTGNVVVEADVGQREGGAWIRWSVTEIFR